MGTKLDESGVGRMIQLLIEYFRSGKWMDMVLLQAWSPFLGDVERKRGRALCRRKKGRKREGVKLQKLQNPRALFLSLEISPR